MSYPRDFPLHTSLSPPGPTGLSKSQPCIGIARMKRWKRAEKLGLNPPIEVLAVLLKEDAKNNVKARRAYVDELVSSNFLVD